jgi:hypothetical protein
METKKFWWHISLERFLEDHVQRVLEAAQNVLNSLILSLPVLLLPKTLCPAQKQSLSKQDKLQLGHSQANSVYHFTIIISCGSGIHAIDQNILRCTDTRS